MPTLVLEQGTVLATKYELLRPAGFGGMAQLWVAKNRATGAEVCIKILVPENSDDEAVERFRREAYAAARLSHRAIIRIFDLVELGPTGEVTSGKPAALAIVMELLRGETLGDLLMKRGKLPLEEAIDLAIPLVSALAHAHRAGVVHRDLKPDNIFLSTDPDDHVIPKVLDFGVSKMQSVDNSKPLTFDGIMLGTPSFMSPEQAKGKRDIDARSDVFSAGILMYMMLAGKNPFDRESFHATVSAIVNVEPPRLPVPGLLWDVIAKALAKDAADRFADATELGIALRRASGRTSITDSGPQLAAALPTSARKLVPALGGDSHVSVPPVSGAGGEPLDAGEDAPPRTSPPAARRRAVRIVMAVVGASLALTVAALLRAPVGSSTSSSAASNAGSNAGASVFASASGAPPEATSAATAPSATTAATAPSATTAPSEPTPAKTAVAADAGAATKALPTPSTTATGPRLEKKPAAVPSAGKREPSIVRDPGF